MEASIKEPQGLGGKLSTSAPQTLITIPFVFASGVAALWISWMLLSSVNFTYPLWYKLLDIDQHIEKFAPQNRNRDNFIDTTAPERYRLFGEVVSAINSGGEGLAEIEYHNIHGDVVDTMYTEAEVIHLQDVANLVALFDWLAYGCLLVVIVYTTRFVGLWGGKPLKPDWRVLHLAVLIALVLSIAVVFIVGPKEVFHFAHEVAFPDEHQWFFYYQDSLMATSMKAPDLFGGLAVQWAILALVGYYLWLYCLSTLLKRRVRNL